MLNLRMMEDYEQDEPNEIYYDNMNNKDQFMLDRPGYAKLDDKRSLYSNPPIKNVKVRMPQDKYTPLMNSVTDYDKVKNLVEQQKVDINQLTWQNQWGHYVTALDCAIWYYNKGNQEAGKVASYLRSYGAKTSAELGMWSDYQGQNVLSKNIKTATTTSFKRK